VAFQFHFEWDPAKARQNARKHRVTFERGATVFSDPNALSLFDEQHSDEEERWITLGLDQTAALLVISHTYHEEASNSARVRLISVRKATRNETKQYQRK
jgi:uncharacterized DUF497 family protein